MNKLDALARSRILHMLCEGQSVRSITRIMGTSKNTVAKLLSDAGAICAAYHHANVREVKVKHVQLEEIWSFAYAKQKNVVIAKAAPDGAGDTWTWAAIDADSKMVISYFVGGRNGECAMRFMDDLQTRLDRRVQLTSDDHKAYLEVVEGALGTDIDYAMLAKIYGEPEGHKGASDCRFGPTEFTSIHKTYIEGSPEPKHVNTPDTERQNPTMRMHMHRFTHLTNGFSKKVEQHANAVALHFMYYNFVKIHSSLRMTPAMAAGVTDKRWDIGDIVALIEAKEAEKPTKRGPYKKHSQISN